MYDLTKLNKTGVIICPNSTKEQILKIINNDFSYNYKFITKEELFNNVYFSYDEKAVLYLMKKSYSYDTSVEILKNLTFIKKGNDKLDELYSLKEELIKNNLLKSNHNFIYLLKNKSIYIINYSTMDKELTTTLDSLNLKYEYLKEDSNNNVSKEVLNFDKVDKEVKYIFNEICRLVKEENIPLNKIHLYSIPSVYLNTVKKYASLYNMPINFPSEITLYHTPLFKSYLDLVSKKGLTGGLEIIDSRIDPYNIKDAIITILNNIINLDEEEDLKLELLINAAKNKIIKTPIFKDGIDIVSSDYRGDDYIFMMGFSLGNYPIIHKDTALLSDEEKTLCFMNTSSILNNIEEEKIINFINQNKNIYITKIKKEGKDLGTTFFNSLLIDKLKMKEIAYDENNESDVLYIENVGKILTAKAYDMKRNYNADSKYLDAYSKDDISYLSFDHKFKPSDNFKNDKNMKVSYSRINEYYKCPFAYFIKYICLKGQGFEDTFDTKLGKLFHKILEESLTKEICLDDYSKEIEENFTEPDENHFIKKLLPQVMDVINKNKIFLEISKFNNPFGEQEINVSLDSKTILNGRIDKIILNDKDKEAIIVDYKSSNSLYFNKDYVQYGLSMQLPTYALLSNEVWPTYKVLGLYIQHILTEDYSFEKSYLLNGVSLKDASFIERIEPNIGNNESNNSTYLESISLTQDQTRISRADTKKNLLLENELEELYKTTKEKYLEAVKNIRDGKFNINPIYINEDDSNSCKYCPLKTICFKDDDDINYVDNVTLKGDEENGD